MGNKLYVGNLSYNVTDEDLKELFTRAGEVASAKVIIDHVTGRSKGFGFVEMASEADAVKAISELNGQNFMDRPLNVSEARPQRERSGGGGRGGYGGGRGSRGYDRKPERW